MFAFAALPSIWSKWLHNQNIPCHVILNREHVIPKSIIADRSVTEAHHNIIGFPNILNSRRSNVKYVDSKKVGLEIRPCLSCKSNDCPLLGKLNREGFTPPAIYKPIIAASVLRTLYNRPEVIDIVHAEVLDLGLAMDWANNGFEDLPPEIKSIFQA